MTETKTDLEMVDIFIETCQQHINPATFREIRNRGLYDIINFLPKDIAEAKAVARARMSKRLKYFGDPEIDKIAGQVNRLEFLRKELVAMNMADAHKTLPILEEMQTISCYVKDYFKPVRIP